MTAERIEPAHQARRIDTERKRQLVIAAAEAQIDTGRHPSISSIARQAGVGRKFIYDHPDLRADIELKLYQDSARRTSDITAAARVSGASLRAELENCRAQNHRLTKQIRALETRLSRSEGARLVADELLPDTVIAELADRQLAGRVAELDRQLFEAREQARRVTEELEAARSINRELMQRLNLGGHPSPADPSGSNAATRPRRRSAPSSSRPEP